MEEVVLKMARKETQMRNNTEGGEIDPAEGVRRRCKKNFPAPTSHRIKRADAVPAPLTRGDPKWRGNFPDGFALNRLEFF